MRSNSGIHSGQAFMAILVCLPLLASACATPVGVKRVDARQVHRELTRDVLSAEKPSGPTRNVLYEQNLFERFQDDPEAALAKLHGLVVVGTGGQNELFALAELSFLHAENTRQQAHYPAAAVYAFAFLFPDSPADAPNPFDPRLRQAANLYNRGLTAGFASADGSRVEPRAGEFGLPFGTLDVTFDEASLGWAGRRLSNFVPVAELEVRELQTRYRRSGIGAPLAASAAPVAGQASADDLLASDAKVPVTAVLRLDDVRPQLLGGRLRAGGTSSGSSATTRGVRSPTPPCCCARRSGIPSSGWTRTGRIPNSTGWS
jgi:hypothetical protein